VEISVSLPFWCQVANELYEKGTVIEKASGFMSLEDELAQILQQDGAQDEI